MSVLPPLVLSDRQVAIVRRAASRVPERWRSRYLDAVADQLLCDRVIDDDAVLDAVQVTALKFYVSLA